MTTPRDRVLDLISRLQQRAWSAIDVGWSWYPRTLPGTRIAGDEKHLRWCMEHLGLISDLVEEGVSGTLRPAELRDHLYSLLYISMSAAEFIGSRARVSLSQRNYYASEQARAAGRRSAAQAAGASRAWQEHAEALALKVRGQKPKLSRERLATKILEGWGEARRIGTGTSNHTRLRLASGEDRQAASARQEWPSDRLNVRSNRLDVQPSQLNG
jgi:hypothetical protein